MGRFLTILEVSQKQAYIFASNKAKENITNSAIIAYVLSPEYIESILKSSGYTDAGNMVYSGGGHTVLQFEQKEDADQAVSVITETVYRDFDGLMIFARTIPYDESKAPEDNLLELTRALERKKARRESAFRQGSYGIEAIDSDTLDVKLCRQDNEKRERIGKSEKKESAEKFVPDGFKAVEKFEKLGGSKNDSNFIAVVHIDGNGMGKRTEELYEKIGDTDWEGTRAKLREFSESIDHDFKEAYRKMAEYVGRNLSDGGLKDKLSLENDNFPVRRIITAGDDICFVTEGRIGIECARVFLEYLSKEKNKADEKNYSACAGVAIVHQKYPFYKAYELAELLCGNAKKYGARISPSDNGRQISAIDWHVEFGEVKDTLKEIRSAYQTYDGNRLELRPYIVTASDEIMNQPELTMKKYGNFRKIMAGIQDKENLYGMGKIKELRSALKKGITATQNYLAFNRMENIITGNNEILKAGAFIETEDQKKHSIIFDAIEIMDTYLALEGDVD